ncbi:hypothetical protein KQX54_008026 [Cotesia glomerata]|uniref:Uncharacterized protein n=1 Tax=Cotesia glomerata TaxID=32391 RepID=A0AAV7J5N9_COTGL|nr:hypothetical protein KQX54_008026 [Cotesia glomerata]
MSKARILIGYGQFRRQTDVSPGIYTDDGDATAAEAAVEDWFAIITVWHGVSPYIDDVVDVKRLKGLSRVPRGPSQEQEALNNSLGVFFSITMTTARQPRVKE